MRNASAAEACQCHGYGISALRARVVALVVASWPDIACTYTILDAPHALWPWAELSRGNISDINAR